MPSQLPTPDEILDCNVSKTHTNLAPMKPSAPQIVAYLLPILLGILTTNTAFTADANPPEKMAYQGYMTDSNGDPLGATAPANYDTVFRIWSVLEGNASARSLMVRTTDGDLRQGLLQRAARRGEPIRE